MGYWASKAKMSYEFTRAIPEKHPANIAYQDFRKKYGQDGNLIVVAIETNDLFKKDFFDKYRQLETDLKKIEGVTHTLSVPGAINLVKIPETEKLQAVPVFPENISSQQQLDSCFRVFFNLPFYKGLLYNPSKNAFLLGINVQKDVMNTQKRDVVVGNIESRLLAFEEAIDQHLYISGLPLIRTELATRVAAEMKWFLFASVVLSAVILLLFFRSVSTMLLSLAVVIIGVVCSVATIALLGFQINLLSALIPPLIVVIGIPNCIYFLNKYHNAYNQTGNREQALQTMVDRMGIVTLFCNVAAAIGFAVFALTESSILKEFGIVSGINIMLLFFISLILIPAVLSYLPPPKKKHTRYLENRRLNRWLSRLEKWALNHRRLVYIISFVLVGFAIAGIFKLESRGYIVDDLPKNDRIYKDLSFFEQNFKGVMPLEVLVKTKSKAGIIRDLKGITNIDSMSQYLQQLPEVARPLSIVEGLKFAKQAFFEGDTLSYTVPTEFDMPALVQYLKAKKEDSPADSASQKNDVFNNLLQTFLDSNRQEARISVNMADIGTKKLPLLMDSLQQKMNIWFPEDKYTVTYTGTTITFIEGSSYIINGLKESIFWAFILIALCMLYLFKSAKILLCSLIPNLVPLAITAGVMGWCDIPLKPSTVLVFSVALGIAIDITIRFLVNYKQELPMHNNQATPTVLSTINNTGISIIYTSLVLIAGFVIFGFSSFGGTKALGWLTSLTLVTATFTNLVLLPALLIGLNKKQPSKNK